VIENGNWGDVRLKVEIEIVEVGCKIHTISWMSSVPTTLLHSHMYGRT
jgi:hypothetical protein